MDDNIAGAGSPNGTTHNVEGVADNHSPPIEKNTYIARRLFKSEGASQPDFINADGKIRFLMSAFFESRANADISIDIMWDEGSTGRRAKSDCLKNCGEIAESEGHKIKGWAALRNKDVLATAKDTISGVINSPTKTNNRHGDIVKEDFLKIAATDDKSAARKKANLVAKVLTEAYNSAGEFLSPIPSQAISNNEIPIPAPLDTDSMSARVIHANGDQLHDTNRLLGKN